MADEPSLEHGPNPALSAQPGVGVGGYSEPEYPEATSTLAVPTSDHGTGVLYGARTAGRPKAARKADSPKDTQEPKAEVKGEAKPGAGDRPVRASTSGETRRP